MEFIVAIGVVMQNHTPGGRIDGDFLDPGNDGKCLADLFQQFGIALAGRNFHPHPAGNLVFDLHFHLGHGIGSDRIMVVRRDAAWSAAGSALD